MKSEMQNDFLKKRGVDTPIASASDWKVNPNE